MAAELNDFINAVLGYLLLLTQGGGGGGLCQQVHMELHHCYHDKYQFDLRSFILAQFFREATQKRTAYPLT